MGIPVIGGAGAGGAMPAILEMFLQLLPTSRKQCRSLGTALAQRARGVQRVTKFLSFLAEGTGPMCHLRGSLQGSLSVLLQRAFH